MIQPKTIKERYVLEFLYTDMWSRWITNSGLQPYMFKSVENAIENLKEALDENRNDSYRFDYLRNTKYRVRKIYLFDDLYTDEIEEITI